MNFSFNINVSLPSSPTVVSDRRGPVAQSTAVKGRKLPSRNQNVNPTGEPKFIKCKICNKTQLAKQLSKHEKTHDRKTKAECQYCRKKFATAAVLRNHVRMNCEKIDGFKRKRLCMSPKPAQLTRKAAKPPANLIPGRLVCMFCKVYTTNSEADLKMHKFNIHEWPVLRNLKVDDEKVADNRSSSSTNASAGLTQINCLECLLKFETASSYLGHKCFGETWTRRQLF
jgi:hypothetical protein